MEKLHQEDDIKETGYKDRIADSVFVLFWHWLYTLQVRYLNPCNEQKGRGRPKNKPITNIQLLNSRLQ